MTFLYIELYGILKYAEIILNVYKIERKERKRKKEKNQFALRAKITAQHSQLPLEGKGVRVNSVVILQGADISPQHTKTM